MRDAFQKSRKSTATINAALESSISGIRVTKAFTNAEKEAREQQEREANGGETNAEKEAREAREKKEREAVAVMRMRQRRLALEQDKENESFIY